MSAVLSAGRAGLTRGRIELRHTLTTPQDVWAYVFPAVALIVVMTFMRGSSVPGMRFSLSSLTLPGVLGMNIALGGLINLATQLASEREDGTLLRAKAVPNGMLGYLVGKIVQVSGMTLIAVALVLIPGVFLFDGLELTAGTWFTLLWVLVLGLVATMPIGAVVGSLLSSPRSMGVVMLPTMAIIGISGVFYPITALPTWLQGLGQVFPIYWLGLGTRSALLPDSLSAVELTHSWRHFETMGVLLAWAVAGLVLAPVILRRMARRESGSSVAARMEKAMQRAPR
ncbi:ABC transporter permease [Amycolatopsis acidicola]|uniref:ABC transporter permease n=1 Tax=Amycolatopsis acidicola TaxID=2596893 RepID=A0A5N0UW99_9PSEU|nr:ABC transporter permease [Amycolatopsis acidicola]KAA9153273.1 ABC transporter permease [Amycolatopsis acidicola]